MAVSITGNVTGAEQKLLPGIVVKAVHEPTGSTFANKTDTKGNYVFNRLKAGGPYLISISILDYSPVELTGIHLKTEESLVHNINLAPVG